MKIRRRKKNNTTKKGLPFLKKREGLGNILKIELYCEGDVKNVSIISNTYRKNICSNNSHSLDKCIK